jgi:hypothetical protein
LERLRARYRVFRELRLNVKLIDQATLHHPAVSCSSPRTSPCDAVFLWRPSPMLILGALAAYLAVMSYDVHEMLSVTRQPL